MLPCSIAFVNPCDNGPVYFAKEIFYTLQGEGANAGTPAVFCRLSGCNLWSGREEDRARAACGFCDTDFVGTDGPGGGRFAQADALAAAIEDQWPTAARDHRFVVMTGGEPLLQLDSPLIDALHGRGFRIAVETNGTIAPAPGIDWLCVSPKGGNPLAVHAGNELKLVYPQPDAPPERFESLAFDHFYLQPLYGPATRENTAAAVRYCLAHPRWKLSIQAHKMIGIR
jgi:7-carboxy-7-deazaguanine synthase